MQPEQAWEERNSVVVQRTWMNSHFAQLNQAQDSKELQGQRREGRGFLWRPGENAAYIYTRQDYTRHSICLFYSS